MFPGCKSPYLDREVRSSVTGPGDMGVAEQGAGMPRPLAGPAPLLQVHRVWISTQYLHSI